MALIYGFALVQLGLARDAPEGTWFALAQWSVRANF
jgi:hypothetical protein